MLITYDEPKRLANLAKHGLDFADLTLSFFESSRVIPARGGRFQAIGKLADGTISVVFATLRPASAKERKLLE
jgi:uncharacterized DUF497 family protein